MQNLLQTSSILENRLSKYGIYLIDTFCLDENGEVLINSLKINLNKLKYFLDHSIFSILKNNNFHEILHLNDDDLFESGLGEDIDIDILENVIEITEFYSVQLKEQIQKNAEHLN